MCFWHFNKIIKTEVPKINEIGKELKQRIIDDINFLRLAHSEEVSIFYAHNINNIEKNSFFDW